MYSRPTLTKTVCSLLAGFLVDYLLAPEVLAACQCLADAPCECPQPWFRYTLDPLALFVSACAVVLVYVVWSRYQKF